MTFTELFKETRKKQRVTIRKLAEDTGYSVSHLSDLEHGRQQPTNHMVSVMALYFGESAFNDFIPTKRSETIDKIHHELLGMSMEQLEDVWAKIESEIL